MPEVRGGRGDERTRAVIVACVASLMVSCGREDSAKADRDSKCAGPPLTSVEQRQEAFEKGYTINQQYDCIDRQSYEVIQSLNAAASPDKLPAIRKPATLRAAREGFVTKVSAPASGTALPEPPPELFVRSDYRNPQDRTLAAYVTPDPGDGEKHPAIVWLTGGDSNTLEDFWTEGAASNDQSASAYRKAGLVMMFPTLRGGNVDTGGKEFFYGEVDDVLAAAEHLAQLAYVDPQYIYLGGHSTGGTLALLTAEASTRFKAVFAFGPVSKINRYPASLVPDAILNDAAERELRSPVFWLDGLTTPTWLIEGAGEGNRDEVESMCSETRNPAIHCIVVPGFDHFSVLGHVSRMIAARMSVANTGVAFSLTQEQVERAGAN
jgi:hypothetical protein